MARKFRTHRKRTSNHVPDCGRNAFAWGHRFEDNPHRPHDAAWLVWNEAFKSAQDDSDESGRA